jgi:shikimate dehydrogenase
MNVGLIGKGISHSFSKSYFENTIFKNLTTSNSYTNFDLDDISEFSDVIKNNSLAGLNVTKPYKESVIQFLDELDDVAKSIGAVNCIKISTKNSKLFLKGFNTDYYGFSQSIKPFLEPVHSKALILGTGGASKAVEYALKNIGVDTYFVTSSEKKSSNQFNYSELNEHFINAFKLIINCTPLGLYPKIEECPNIPYEFITSEHLLYDLIYNPEETLFLKKGKEKGAITINGLNMLKLQADKAWEIWNTKE